MGNVSKGRLLAVLAAVLVFAVAFLASRDSSTEADPAETALAHMEIGFITEDGNEASLANYSGEPLVVNFFASWCGPCRAEMPDFEAVANETTGEITFLGVNTDLNESTWRSFVGETGITYETVFDPSRELFAQVKAIGMPTTLFIGRDGKILETHTGPLNQESLTELIDLHLREN